MKWAWLVQAALVHAAQHARDTSAAVGASGRPEVLMRSERLQPEPRLESCSGPKLECAAKSADPCAGTDCQGHHACLGGFKNCMVKIGGLTGTICASADGGCVPACQGARGVSEGDCRNLPRGTQCQSTYMVIDNVATQCFATLGQNDAEVECENGHPCGDPERENPYQGAR
mmetsp:Transcript_98572/g.234794  ORF Transcript_98572/g.234794 Transcript_98572/m.234794 type:complete len:172 (+) Transcript_98572:90-605(+)